MPMSKHIFWMGRKPFVGGGCGGGWGGGALNFLELPVLDKLPLAVARY